ncbi:MAG TPA: histidine phosphatase family protein [Ktedonobacteraceae bacterium]|jgi:probable phosphoglycerate mutase|nr:histidine phosphatase family protein [Ktedonobacteraceae bacterium]
MTRLYLIRHAEANSAIQGFIGDGGLSPLGILQAKRLRDRLAASKEIAADVLIASTLPRARQTAEIIAPALGLPVQLDDSLQELRPGEADGMPVEQFQARFGEPDYENDPYRIIAPGGESWAQFMLRVGSALDRIVREYEGQTIVLVCHGGVIDGSFLYFFKMSAWTLPPARFYTRNTSITLWQQLASGPYKPHWHLLKYNDAFHLHDIGTPVRIPWGQISASPASDQDRPSVPIESESFSAREPSSETNLSQEEK